MSNKDTVKLKRFELYLDEESKEKALKRAEEKGIIRNGKGNLSAYVRQLIFEDTKEEI